MKIDNDIQEAVADEFCKAIDKGGNLFMLVGWSIEEIKRRQAERDKAKVISGKPE